MSAKKPPQIVSKSEFARLCKVAPARVTQWIDKKVISGPALHGEGRSAKIVVEVAQRQVRARRDVGQALGNGLETRLGEDGASAAPKPNVRRTQQPDLDATTGDALNEQLKREKLWAIQASNRETARKEAAAQGLYTETAAVRRQMTTIAVQMVRTFEGALPEIASALATEFKCEERDVLQALNGHFRKMREKAAETAQRSLDRIDATVPAPGEPDAD